jgi:tRNA(fMet)-specific endonuclease VapC
LAFVLDTSVAIHLRDHDQAVMEKVYALGGPFSLSIITRVELEAGVHRDGKFDPVRRRSLDALLEELPQIPFGEAAAEAYAHIVGTAGYSRRKVIDRMIAAQALAANATLVTLNPQDFADVQGLKLLAW